MSNTLPEARSELVRDLQTQLGDRMPMLIKGVVVKDSAIEVVYFSSALQDLHDVVFPSNQGHYIVRLLSEEVAT